MRCGGLTEYIKHGGRWLFVLVICSHYKSELFDNKTQALKNPLDVNQAGFGAECFGIDGLFHFAASDTFGHGISLAR